MSQNAANIVPGSGVWVNLSDDNTPDFVVKIDTSDVGKNGQAQTPTLNLVVHFVGEDADIDTNDPADKTGVGATEFLCPGDLRVHQHRHKRWCGDSKALVHG